jgi:hypothetical protein
MTFAKKNIRTPRNFPKWKLIIISVKHQQLIHIHTINHASIVKISIINYQHTIHSKKLISSLSTQIISL